MIPYAVFKDFLYGLSQLIYPPNCLICQRHLSSRNPTEFLCAHCQNLILYNIPPFCPKCSRHLKNHFEAPTCKECRRHQPCFDFAWGCCLYDEPLKHLLHDFKYNQKTWLRYPLTQLMIHFINQYHFDIEQFELLIPIPLSATRLRERGYNQSHLLAKQIAQTFHIDLSTRHLMRTRHTQSQTLLPEKERWTNICDAFRIKNPTELIDKKILLVDDLLTTGATASEAARVLKDAGAKQVGVLTLGITV